jgi:hypothetical protein
MSNSGRSGRAGNSGGGAVAVLLFAYLIIFFSPAWMILYTLSTRTISPPLVISKIQIKGYLVRARKD